MRKSKLSWYKQSRLIELFVAGSTARTAASLIGVNKTTASYYFHKLRVLIYENSQDPGLFEGEIEVDESYFGGTRKGKRGRGAGSKLPVFGLLKRNGKVYACIIPNAKADTLIPIIREKVKPDSIVYPDSFKSYNALDVSEFKHFRVNHSKEFTCGKNNHINGIENFWNQSKRTLRKYNGIDKKNFHLFLKECEFRFNYGSPSNQLKILRKWCDI
ncbi:IS1595 family transposase [uncultured Psychrobacter sp.]|uniref:IS1595 family transposase n=1 Tax=uncultured Psychrobacter sp. TaxID=259303 RepID=UPI00345A7F0A